VDGDFPYECVRSTPIVTFPYVYQGSFEYPSWEGHFRRYLVTNNSYDTNYADWDTADGHIPNANTGNSDGRKVYTAKYGSGSWSKIDFDIANMADLEGPLNITPGNGDNTDEEAVIERLRGKICDSNTGQWVERGNKLGGIMHSAPVIVGANSRTGSNRPEMAYVGDLYGILHAIETATGDERWAYIPSNLLGKLQNDRTDSDAIQGFAAVDGSPTARDVFYDHDNDDDKEWRTILICPEGLGGKAMFALDVTAPDNWSVLWEITDAVAPGGGMGHAYCATLDKVKWPVRDEGDEDSDGDTEEIIGCKIKWVAFVATCFGDIAPSHGGVNVFAFDLRTGNKLWHFSQEYADSTNEIPRGITAFDTTGDNFVDRVYVGDMDGRMWEINAVDGSNPNGFDEVEGKQIPLWNAGKGNPISVSPAIIRSPNGNVVLVFGTGGSDGASDSKCYSIYAVDATEKQEDPTYSGGAGTLLWEVMLSQGEKVWSAPTIADGHVYVATTTGAMESPDPIDDKSGSGWLRALDLRDGSMIWGTPLAIGKIRGSVYMDRQHLYMTTVDNKIIQVGDGDFSLGNANNVALKAWRQL
jgi:Tfp pilus tip-associated adhesin PilY1